MRLACSVLALTCAQLLSAQDLMDTPDSLGRYGRIAQSWISLRVSPGREAHAIQEIRELSSEWKPAALGSIVRTKGEGSPHRVLACGLDETSYVVSHITDNGYLRVHIAGARATPAGWDQMHIGQRVLVMTTDRANAARVRRVPGVFGVRSTHLWRRAPGAANEPATIEDLWVDVGARNAAEVASMGIRLLDPVFRDMPDWSVGDAVVGPFAAARAGCAAVAAASEQMPISGRTSFVISTHSAFAWGGLNAVVRALGDVDTVIVAHPSPARGMGAVRIRAQYPGTLVETIDEATLRSYFATVAREARTPEDASPVRVRLTAASTRAPQPTDSLSRYSELLGRLTDSYAVFGDEGPIRDVLRARLPAWARDSVQTDTAGNLVLAMGPDKDTVVFIAHMDEVGFEVVSARNGIAVLRTRGGLYPALWAGQTALLHLPSGDRSQGCRPTSGSALRGIFLPPDSLAQPGQQLRAWFGSELDRARDVVGSKVTSYKCSTRLGAMRFTSRGIDDRLGSAALVLALDGINRGQLAHKLIFVWAVREEGGLEGARAVAAEYGISVTRVHTVDTFVSADAPLETGRFAVTPIGDGAVVRGLDNASVIPPAEIERVVRIARAARVPLQIGTTNGGTDGSAFVPYGAPNVGVSWPLRYSHSPVELIDLRDMRSLVRLIAALAVAKQQ
jgi:putative aminopeptidase FrvX